MNILFIGLSLLFYLLLISGCTLPEPRQFMLDRQREEQIILKDIDVEEYAKTYPSEDGVYLYREYAIELVPRIHRLGLFDCDAYEMGVVRYLVLDPNAEWLGTFELEVEEGKELRNAFITIFSPDGSRQTFDESDMKVEEDSEGDRRYLLAYPDIVKGSVIDEGFELASIPTSSNTEYDYEIPLQFSAPCERLSVRLAYPEKWTVALRGGKPVDTQWEERYELVTESKTDLQIATYDAFHIPPLKQESYSPSPREYSRYLEARIEKIVGASYEVSILPKNWRQYMERMYKGVIDDVSAKDSELTEQVTRIINSRDSDSAKIGKILTWIYDEIKSDPYAFKDKEVDPLEVLEKRTGRPHQVTALAYLMLKNAGVNATYLVIHTPEDGRFTQDFLHPRSFYMTGVEARTDDATYWLFPYIRHYPMGYVPAIFQERIVLRMNDSGYRGFDTIQTSLPAPNKTISDFDVVVDDEGVLHVTEMRTLYGDAGFFLRREIEGADTEEIERKMKELIVYDHGEVKMEEYQLENQDDYNKPFVIHLQYQVDNLVTITPEEVILQSDGLFAPAISRKFKTDPEKRQNPIKIYQDEELVKEIRLRIPKKWHLQDIPEDRKATTSLGEVSADYSSAPGEFHVEYRRQLHRAERPASDYKELFPLISTRSAFSVPALVFTVE